MQKRRLQENPRAYAQNGSHLFVADEYWNNLCEKNLKMLCNLTFFEPLTHRGLQFRFLNEDVGLDVDERCLLRFTGGRWVKTDDPLLELVTVLYLNNVKEVFPLGRDIVGIKDLKERHFFAGPHELKLDPLLKRYGHDLEGFRQAAEALGGQSMEMADAAYRLMPFPRVALYYLLWEGDEEFRPRVQVLFDRLIEEIFAADAIWGLVNRVTMALAQI